MRNIIMFPIKCKNDIQYTYNVTFEARSCNHCCSGKAINVTYSECVFVALGTQHVKRLRLIILSSVACPALPYIFHIVARKYKMTISSTKTKPMAMWRNHIQRVKIVINENIIEQVTDFKYLGYRI